MKKHLLTTALLGALSFTTLAPTLSFAQTAGSEKITTQSKIDQNTLDTLKTDVKELTDKERLLATQITEAFDNINQAQQAILDKDKTLANDKLTKALGQLDAVISLNPDLQFIPLNKEYITTDSYHDADTVIAARRIALGYLRRGRVQDARLILSDMASELDVRTTNLPLVGYVNAIRFALPLINDDDFDGAKTILDTAILTRVITDEVMPLPIVRMVVALEAAQALELEKGEMTEEKKTEVLENLDYAQEQMKLAVAFGYADKGAYKQSLTTIRTLRKNLKNAASNTDTYTKVLSDTKDINDHLETAKDRADERKAAEATK